MSREITNTKRTFKKLPLIPDGRRRYVVTAPVLKLYGKNNSEFFVWSLQYQDDKGNNCLGEIALMPNMLAGLLRVLGFHETEPEVFDWDTNDAEGLSFMATSTQSPDKKDSTITRVHFTEYAKGDADENEIPYGND
jgi:hypothetical protein